MRTAIRVAVVLMAMVAGTGQALAVTIDFDDLVGPVVLSNQYAGLGVTFSAFEDAAPVGAIAGLSLTATSHTAPNVWSNCFPTVCSGRADVLRIDFATPVNNLQWFTDTAGPSQPTFNAYAFDGTLLESILATATPEGTYALSAFSAVGISYVELLQPDDFWGYYLDTISFEPAQAVPEPATLLLLGTGLGAVAARRRLKNRHNS